MKEGLREESPDTTLRGQSRATRLVTPGDAARNDRVTESATENIPPAERIPVIARQEKPSGHLPMERSAGKGEKVG